MIAGTSQPGIVWWRAPNLSGRHGFQRAGMGEARPWNLSERVAFDAPGVAHDPARLAANRAAALAALGLPPGLDPARLEQVHGAEVVTATRGGPLGRADALVTREAGLPLVIETADCLALLFEDPQAGVIGAAHAGWRGTLAGVAGETVRAMTALGARPERVRVAVGPGLCAACLEVGAEVRAAFLAAGFPAGLFAPGPAELACDEMASPARPDWGVPELPPTADDAPAPEGLGEGGMGKWRLNLAAANLAVLRRAGVRPEHVLAARACTREQGLFSHRRDRGETGRHWALIALAADGSGR